MNKFKEWSFNLYFGEDLEGEVGKLLPKAARSWGRSINKFVIRAALGIGIIGFGLTATANAKAPVECPAEECGGGGDGYSGIPVGISKSGGEGGKPDKEFGEDKPKKHPKPKFHVPSKKRPTSWIL